MLATIGWPIAGLTHRIFVSQFDLKPTFGIQDKDPSIINRGLGLTNPLFWVGAISAAAALEFVATNNGDSKEQATLDLILLELVTMKTIHARGRAFQWTINNACYYWFRHTRVLNHHVGNHSDTNFPKIIGNLVEHLLLTGGATSL